MSDETAKGKRRSRKTQGRIRKDQIIDNIVVEEPFSFQHPIDEDVAGEGAYISATINNRRYYGVIVDQATLKAATLINLQHEASGLDLNRRMRSLFPVQLEEERTATFTAPAEGTFSRQVQKFRFLKESDNRQLLATYCDAAAASEDDPASEKLIQEACDAGGNFVGMYYYQYVDMNRKSLLPLSGRKNRKAINLSMAMSFDSFLEMTPFPPWSPQVSLDVGQQAVMNMLQLRKDGRGNFVPDHTAVSSQTLLSHNTLGRAMIPMEPRHFYRVAVVGAGIAGLSACLEIFRLCEREGLDVEVHLLEGRNRIGGRLHTDRKTFKLSDGVTNFPVDLGASWIHGIEMNPLAALAQEAGVDFVVTSEDVKMLQENMNEVDPTKDKYAGELFDKLLDAATEMTWSSQTPGSSNKQSAVRWYASVLDGNHKRGQRPLPVSSPDHRRSSDISVDQAIGRAIAEQLLDEFGSLSLEERRMLFWNMKNVEYALGANLSDLSQMFWDIDERHAFEGDHVVLRQGYSVVAEYVFNQLQKRVSRFHYHSTCPVGKIEYDRPSTSQMYIGKTPKRETLMDLSDTCCVISEEGSTKVLCDFVVSAVPLGVLKEALQSEETIGQRLQFDPPLPFCKQDSIANVGFGLLDKIFLQFPTAFWRTDNQGNPESHTLFGNASGVHPHHYMFLDVGKALDTSDNPPAILMSLVSGVEAVHFEWSSTTELVKEVMETLRCLFGGIEVPDPIRVKATKWGSDRFSRGSYTFLGPGTTEADFHVLQSPCNGNGDGILLYGPETMRLFFAGEHTTALHPSMAHGAMLSGMRAGREVFEAMNLTYESEEMDRLIPLSLYRHIHPDAPLECALCLGNESAVEGPLLTFKRGTRYVCVHTHCAEASPEVAISDGKWENVVKAVNRGLVIDCDLCGQTGASIGCQDTECHRSYHYACAIKSGWDFENLGKEYRCEDHRDEAFESVTASHGPLHSPLNSSLDHAKPANENETTKVKDYQPSTAGLLKEKLEGERALCRSIILQGFDSQECPSSLRLVRVTRESTLSSWNMELKVSRAPGSEKYNLFVARPRKDRSYDDDVVGDPMRMINGKVIGSSELDTLSKVVSLIGQETDLIMQVGHATG